MQVDVGRFYMDSDENVYRCVAAHRGGPNGYEEAVLELQGEFANKDTMFFAIFFKSHYAWLDRECPEYRLTEEVDYFPHIVTG